VTEAKKGKKKWEKEGKPGKIKVTARHQRRILCQKKNRVPGVEEGKKITPRLFMKKKNRKIMKRAQMKGSSSAGRALQKKRPRDLVISWRTSGGWFKLIKV